MAEVKIEMTATSAQATAEIKKFESQATSSINKIKDASSQLNRTTMSSVTQTYELSKATRQFGLALNGLSFLPVIGNYAAMGSMITYTAGSIKNLTAGIKTLGGVSLPIIGSLTTGVVALAGLISGFGVGVLLDEYLKINKVSFAGIIKDWIDVRNIMKSVNEESAAMAPRLERSTIELAKIGVMPGKTWEETRQRMLEMEKTGEIIYNKELGRYISLAQAAVIANEKIKQANINRMEAEKVTLEGQLSNLKVYYSGLEKLHADYIENSKAKSQELIDLQNSIRTSQLETSNIVASIRQKGMSAADAYYDKVKQLEEAEFQAWMMKPGTEKIDALKNAQQAWSNLTDEVKDGERVIISASEAQTKAINKAKQIGEQIRYAVEDQGKLVEGQKAASDATATSISTAMQAAQASILDINTQIAQLDMSLAKEKNLNINVNQAFDNIKKVREMMDAIPDVTTKKLIIETYTKSSPAVPFSEGIKNMTEALNNLPQSMQFTTDTSSLAGLIQQYKVLGTLMAATLGSYQLGPETVLARTTATASITSIEQSQKLIKNLFNVGMVQAFAGVYAQLEGHEKIDKQLEGLITRYLGNISSFQGLTSPIEFQKPSFIHVDPGETLYPANDNRNYSKNIVNNTIHVHDTGGKSGRAWARELDEELADMWRTGRSRLKRVMQ
jgi:hypothetical protein